MSLAKPERGACTSAGRGATAPQRAAPASELTPRVWSYKGSATLRPSTGRRALGEGFGEDGLSIRRLRHPPPLARADGRTGSVRPILRAAPHPPPAHEPRSGRRYSAHSSGALFPSHPARLDGVVVGGVLLVACGLALAWPTLRVIRAPRDRWIQGRSQWLLFMWARRGEAPPSASELRLWASIWLGVAAILVGLGIALIASA